MAELFFIRWGRIQMFASSIHADNSRTQVVHDLTAGDVHPTQDRGQRAIRTRIELVFDEFPNQPDPLTQALALKAAVNSGAQAILVHPMEPVAYLASVGEFAYTMDEHGTITGTAEFIAEDAVPEVSPVGAAASGTTGEAAVTQAADDLDEELLAVRAPGIPPALSDDEVAAFISDPTDAPPIELSVTDDARISVGRWNELGEDLAIRQVMIDATRISNALAALIEDQGLEDDLQLWPTLQAAILFGAAMRSAAIAATSEVPSVFAMRVTSRTALLPLAARVYGGAAAQDRARQIILLNDIRSPGWLDPGDYLMPARTPAQRSPF